MPYCHFPIYQGPAPPPDSGINISLDSVVTVVTDTRISSTVVTVDNVICNTQCDHVRGQCESMTRRTRGKSSHDDNVKGGKGSQCNKGQTVTNVPPQARGC